MSMALTPSRPAARALSALRARLKPLVRMKHCCAETARFAALVFSLAALAFSSAASAQPAAHSLLVTIEASADQADAFTASLAALEGGAGLVLQRHITDGSGGLLVRLTDPHAGGTALVNLQACSAQDCPEDVSQTALIFARNASPQELAEALRRALGGLVVGGLGQLDHGQSEPPSQPRSGLTAQDLVTNISQQLRAPVRRSEAIAGDYLLDLTLFAPARQDLELAKIERFEALSLLQSRDPRALEDHLQSCRFCAERSALNAQLLSLLAGDGKDGNTSQTQLRQWKAVMANAEPEAVLGFIDAYPNTGIGATIIADVAANWPDQLASVEAKLWGDAATLADPSLMRALLLACQDCGFAQDLEPQVLKTSSPELERETALWQQARQEDSAGSYGRYLDDCGLCLFAPEALRMQQRSGHDPEALNDRKLLAALEAETNLASMRAYLDDCQLCAQRDAIQARYDHAFQRQTTQASCLDLARSPAEGGDGLQPREAGAAVEACLAALDFTDSSALRLVLGEAYRLQGAAEDAVTTFDRVYRDGEQAGLDGLALSLFQFSQAGSDGRRRLANIMEHQPAIGPLSARRALVEALIAIEQLASTERLLPQADIIDLLEAAAAGGEADAAYSLGLLYSFGQLTERNLGKAAQSFQTAAKLGHVEARAYYADHVERGLGVAADYKLAAELYYRALKDRSNWAATRLIEQGRTRPLEVMKHVQRLLRDEGLYRGPIDGVAGGTTTTALERARDRG